MCRRRRRRLLLRFFVGKFRLIDLGISKEKGGGGEGWKMFEKTVD